MQARLRSVRSFLQRRGGRLTGLAAAVSAVAAVTVLAQQQSPDFRSSPFLRIDPERIVLDRRDSRVPCGECHSSEYETWKETKHATGFETMHRTESAHDILEKMGLTVTKRQESLCMRCHYTVGPELTAIAGVSCESCHGPAKEWIDLHNTWGEGVEKPEGESVEHKQQRIAQSTEHGMLRPSGNLYAVAANCYECHTVPMEELVNKGGHSTGSTNFDLLQRVDEIRHNFVQEQWGGQAGNREDTPERKRLLLMTGRILGYEFALRGVAVATTEGKYAKAMERRVSQSRRELEQAARAVDVPAINEILKTGDGLRLVPGNGDAILAAAARIRTAGQRFAATADGSRLAGLDLLTGAATATEPATAGTAGSTAAGGDTTAAGAARGNAAAGNAAAGNAAAGNAAAGNATAGNAAAGNAAAANTASEAPAARPELPGRVRNRPEWQPAPDSRYKTTIANCGKCHDDAEAWWFDDKHQATAERLNNRLPKAVEIATLYGLTTAEMSRGDRICMSCHGTAASATPAAPVNSGVNCERCHGPSSEYLDPHEKGGNPQLGMTALKQADVMAKTCTGCHRISDERLLAAGHPSGNDYDIVAASKKINHWPDRRPERERKKRNETYSGPTDAALKAAFDREVAARPIPQVTVVAAARPQRAQATAQSGQTAGGGGQAPPAGRSPPASRNRTRPPSVSGAGEGPVASRPPVGPSTRPARTKSGQTLEIEPQPAMADTLTSEQLLLLVKRRLERLMTLVTRGN
jgi:Cytochrome c554 and c-prime